MPQTKIDKRSFSEPRKCDAPGSNFVTFEIKDESSPECSPPFNGFFRSGQISKSGVSQDICKGRKSGDNVTHSALSVLSSDSNREVTNRICDLGLHPTNLLNGHRLNNECVNVGNQNKCGSKSTLFSDSLLNSLTSEPIKENGMKIINDCGSQVCEDFSDLLSSISLPDHEPKENSKLYLANCVASDKHGVNGEIHNKGPDCSDDIGKPNGFSTQSKGTLSDILSSISFDEYDYSQTGNKISSNSNQSFTTNQIPILNKLDSESHNGTLSDILSSISFDGIDTSVQNGFESSSDFSLSLDDIKIPTSNELNPGFSTINPHTTNNISKLNGSNLENKGNLSDLLSAITFPENDNTSQSGLKSASFFSFDPCHGFENDSSFKLKDLSNELLNPGDKVKLSTGKPTDSKVFSFPTTEKNTSNNISASKTCNHNKSSMHDDKNGEFSFFSVSPDNVFSAMLSNLSKTSDFQDKNTNEYSDEISMLDLLKSVNTDSNGSLSAFLSTPSEGKEIKTDEQDTVLDEILNIDLSTCIKASDNSINDLRHEPPVNKICINDKDNTELEVFMKPVFENVDSNCPKPPRMNLNQSLFAKSLSCKPKKNRILLQKAALIKSELYKHYFNHICDDAESKMDKNSKWIKDNDTNNEMVICKTNDCMIRFKGRRLCPQEVQ